MELVLVVIGRSFIYLDLYDLFFFFELKLIIQFDSHSFARVTRPLALCVHTRSQLLHFNHHSSALAGGALFVSTVLAFTVATFGADALSVYGNLRLLSCVYLLQGEFHWVHYRLAFLRS